MDQKRFLLAMVLSGAVLVLWQAFFAPPPEDPKQKKAKQAQTAGETSGEADRGDEGSEAGESADETAGETVDKSADEASGDSADQPSGDAELGEAVIEESEAANKDIPVQTHLMQSDRLKVKLTNAGGGRVQAINLLKPEQYKKRENLLDKFPSGSKHLPYAVNFTDKQRRLVGDGPFEFVESASQKDGDGYSKVVYRYQDGKGRYEVDKIFTIKPDAPYVVQMDFRVTNKMDDRVLGDSLTLDMFGYKDPNEETSMLDFAPNAIEGVCQMDNGTQRININSIEAAQRYNKSVAQWGAIDTRYFIWAAVPEKGADKCGIEKIDNDYLRTRLTFSSFSVDPGQTRTLTNKLYMGPKDVDILHEVGHNLSTSVDYGLFSFIARPLRWALNWIHGWVGNWGLAIVLLTILIKLLTWPINMKAYRSMEDMKRIQPKLEEVREKYEDDRQKQTEETMKLFQENDVSPMGGCLPMLLQMPILYGLYIMIYNSVELYHADFILWYDNLAAPDPFYVLPILMGVVMFGQQQMMGAATANAQAKIMTKVMPVMFTAFMLFLPSGLVLYYSINLMIGLGQQFYVRGLGDDANDEIDDGSNDESAGDSEAASS